MQALISKTHRQVVVPYNAELAAIFSHGKQITLKSKSFLAVPHGFEETRALRNMGFSVQAPIANYYAFPGPHKAFAVQVKTCEMLTTNTRAYVLNGLGTGKTSAAIWAWDYLNKSVDARRMLVVTTVSTMIKTWRRELLNLVPERKVAVLTGTKARRLKLLAEPHDVYIINHDGLAGIAADLAKRPDIDCMCLDELAVYRNGKADRTKDCTIVAARMKWVWGMTGGPTPNEPTDVWAQARIITPDTVPKFFGRFREELMYKASPFSFKPKKNATEAAFAALQPSVRYTLDDVTELPELIERVQDVKMGATQEKIYKQIRTKAVAELSTGTINAVNAGVVFSKLLQIACGWVYTTPSTASGNTGRIITKFDNQERLDTLLDAVDNTERKVIVFVPYIHALEGVAKFLREHKIDCEIVSGATPPRERDRLFTLFQDTLRVKVIVAHPKCMAHGLTLTAADTIIWFSPTTSLEIFDQANARIRRVGQKHKQLVLMLQSTAEERRVYARLRAKQKVQDDLLGLFEDRSEDFEPPKPVVPPVNPEGAPSVMTQTPSPPNFEKRTGQYITVRDKIKEMDDAHKATMAPFRDMLLKLNNALLADLNTVNADNVANKYGTVYITPQVSTTVADADAFLRHIIGNEQWELLDKKANKTAVTAFVKETGAPPPGVNYSVNMVVGVRRK